MAVEEERSLLKIVSEKWVKPSSPTPPSSRYYKISALDSYMFNMLTPFAFFYQKESFHGEKYSGTAQLFDLLETSLSRTLTYYYPFAGTFMDDNITVDCNDAGVQLWEVEIQAPMSEILDNRANYINPWNVVILPGMYSSLKSHAKFQLNRFECGGICVVVSMSHKLAEALVVSNFVNDWAKIAQDIPLPSPPIQSGASIFPPQPTSRFSLPLVDDNSFVSQRFFFPSSSISKLKQIVAEETEIQNPSQTEVVTILIFKSIISAAKLTNSEDSFKPCSLIQIANLRSVTIPPLSEQYVGNFIGKFVITIATKENETSFSRLVTELRKSKIVFQDRHRICLDGGNNEFLQKYSRFWEEIEKKLIGDKYIFTSMIRFPYYEADFGFGKPIFVWIRGGLLGEVIILTGTPKGNGIEAFVTLEKEKMFFLERDKELLAYASLNPKICIV